MITVLAGGVGAARMLDAIVRVVEQSEVTAIVNVADDFVLHGLDISPDLDTVTYTLANEIDPGRGWGLRDETWHAMETLGRYGGATWFNLGDRDLGTHLYRTQRLREGASLTTVTAEIARAWGLRLTILPVTDDPVRTLVTLAGDGDPEDDHREIGFQEYFVERQHAVSVSAIRFEGAAEAVPAPDVLRALGTAERIVIAPSNPIVSIGPVLAIPGMRDAVAERRENVVAVSPIIAGSALKGPADRLMSELGHESSVVGVARLYAPIAATLVIDEADRHLADDVEAEGVRCIVTDTVMSEPGVAETLARVVVGA